MSSLLLSVMSPEVHMCKGSQCHLLSGRHFVRKPSTKIQSTPSLKLSSTLFLLADLYGYTVTWRNGCGSTPVK